nr:GNAT family N-acetyltransferase [Flavonifractor plautii]
MWFRPLDLEREEHLYLEARHDAWVDIHGSQVPFDGAGFCRDAAACWVQDKEKALTVAMQRDEVAGVLQLDLARFADQEIGYIPFVYMTPQHRKRGLGVQLIGQAVSVFRPLGRTRLRLRCAPENAVAQRFYKKYGFEKVGEEQGSVKLDILEKYIGYETKD